ncbi:MAG TPA: polysaccharide deacetylase, partial [Polyangiaceae bacterium]
NAHGDNTSWHWQLPAHFPPGRSLRVAVDGGTLSQNGRPLVWDAHGYYEIALDAGSLHWSR